eukprot:623951-Prymnesium_polylepis.2
MSASCPPSERIRSRLMVSKDLKGTRSSWRELSFPLQLPIRHAIPRRAGIQRSKALPHVERARSLVVGPDLQKQLRFAPFNTLLLATTNERSSDAEPPCTRVDAEIEQAGLRHRGARVAHAALVFAPHLHEAHKITFCRLCD